TVALLGVVMAEAGAGGAALAIAIFTGADFVDAAVTTLGAPPSFTAAAASGGATTTGRGRAASFLFGEGPRLGAVTGKAADGALVVSVVLFTARSVRSSLPGVPE